MNHDALNHVTALLADDGRKFAMIRKVDLRAMLDAVEAGSLRAALGRIAELRQTMADQSIVIDEAFACIERNAANALKHGDERRRYMGNNRALLAQAEHQSATVSEMGEVIDEQAARIVELERSLAACQSSNRFMLAQSKYMRSCLSIIRKAATV